MPNLIKPFKVSVERCARCNGDHKEVTFRPFTHPNSHYTHWAHCPNIDEPILLRIEETNEE